MAGKGPHNEETLWGLLPALGSVEDTPALRAIHAAYIDRRGALLASHYFRHTPRDDYQALADSLYEISVNARKALTEAALAAAITASLGEEPRLREAARAAISIHSQRTIHPSNRAKFIELVPLRKLLSLREEISEKDAWLAIVQEMLAL